MAPKMVMGVALVALATMGTSAFAQGSSTDEHSAHHPAGAAPPVSPPTPAPTPAPAPPAAGMDMGAMMRVMQQEMERMHGGAPLRPLVSRLLDGDRLTDAQRRELRADAERRRDEGLRRIDAANRDRATAIRGGVNDDAAIDRAMTGLKEGSVLWETGTVVLRALDSKSPREAGVQWFRGQMRTLPRIDSDQVTGGLSWRHATLMASLAAVVVAGLILYTYRIRRSIALLRRVGGGAPDTPR